LNDAEALVGRDRIVAWGGELGLSALGVAPAEEPAGARFLLEWLLRDHHASMNYLDRDPEARFDPGRILEGCRSILCAALDYGGGTDPAAGDPSIGRISRYAWGDDYHLVLMQKLEALAERIKGEWPEVRTRVAVDTSPVLEKAFAAAAGLGWIGKHTNLIDPHRGSWFFLGEIFTTLPLPRTDPVADRCGSCARCIEICPTEAIVEPYVLDARRCLSYWNIEHRGAIDLQVAPRMDNWIFGCDLCQDVCPWNREAADRTERRFDPRTENVGRPLEEWETLTREEFSRRFRDSAVKRARFDGFARNIGIAADNARNSRRDLTFPEGDR
jgi:epoxyqueuosine reductase